MRSIAMPALVACLLAGPSLAGSAAAEDVVVTPVLKTTTTGSGQPIQLPPDIGEIIVTILDIPPGAQLPVHEHPYPRYAYVMAGTIRVDNQDVGKGVTYKAGEFIVEAVGQWHKGTNVGTDPVQLLVIDMVKPGAKNTVIME